MPAKIMLPTNAKMTALVWSGRRRPKVKYGTPPSERLAGQNASWSATRAPTLMPTSPHTIDAPVNQRATQSL